MIKRFFSLFLAITLLLSFVPLARAANPESLEDILAAQYDAYAASIAQDNMDENALDQLLEPALYGDGSTLRFDESDALTASLYGSSLFRDWFIEAASYGIQNMAALHYSQALIGGTLEWYDYYLRHNIDEYGYNTTSTLADDARILTVKQITAQPIEPNRNDTAIILTVGTSFARLRLNQMKANFDTVTYRVDIEWSDYFSFNGDYSNAADKGYDTSFSELLKALGPILGLKTYYWCSFSSFTIEVPNLCPHSGSGSYYWKNVDNELVSAPQEGQLDNPLTRHLRNASTDTSPRYYYTLETPIELLPSNPWYVEFYISTASGFFFGPTLRYTDTWLPSIYKSGTAVNGVISERHGGHIVETDTSTLVTKRNYFFLDYVDLGIEKKGKKVFRIENRIADDGSNMLWLLIDGQEMGPLNRHSVYDSSTQKTEEYPANDNWFNGKAITVQYLYNYSWPFSTLPLDWIKIDTAGDVLATVDFAPSCTQAGGETLCCLLCGARDYKGSGEPLAHTSVAIPGVAPTCEKEGLSEGAACAVCGEVLRTQTVIPTLPHTEEVKKGFASTCTTAGLSDGVNCAVCHKVIVLQKALPLGKHVEATIVPAKAPTCTEPGNTAAIGCAHCDKVFLEQSVTPALGHAYADGLCSRCDQLDPAARKAGDADNDGEVSYMDAIIVLRASVGLVTPDAITVKACDLDGVDGLSYMDAIAILRISVGL